MRSVTILIVVSCQPASGADDTIAAGRIKADQVCSNCHGLDGQISSGGNSALSPKLAPQRREYLVARLRAYRSGEIEHAQMTLIARMISEQDIDNVATWYSSLETTLGGNAVSTDAELSPGALAGKRKATETCNACHGIDVKSTPGADPAPILVGQPGEYLVDRLRAYRTGRLEHALMTPIASSLSDQDIDELGEWYSGIDVEVSGID